MNLFKSALPENVAAEGPSIPVFKLATQVSIANPVTQVNLLSLVPEPPPVVPTDPVFPDKPVFTPEPIPSAPADFSQAAQYSAATHSQQPIVEQKVMPAIVQVKQNVIATDPEITKKVQQLNSQTKPTEDVGLFNKLKDVVSDVGKTIAYSVAAPVNSITGHKYKPTYSTKVGAVLGQGSNIGIDSIHIAGKAFADTVTGGLATKAANKLRKPENQEKAYAYNEMENFHSVNTGVKAIDKAFSAYEKVSKGGAVVLGAAMGANALKNGADKMLGEKPPADVAKNTGAETKAEVSTMGGLGIAAAAFGAALLLR